MSGLIVGVVMAGIMYWVSSLAFQSGRKEARKWNKAHSCPWEPCGYPLPSSPLQRREKEYYGWTYLPEDCPECKRRLVWSKDDARYVRTA